MSASGYVAAIKGLGVTVLAEADLGFYQGDWVGLVKDNEGYGDRFGFVVVGYGSCSGCDAWESCDNPTDRAKLIAEILTGAHWFEEIDDAKSYIRDAHTNNAGYFVHEDDWPDFVKDAVDASEWAAS